MSDSQPSTPRKTEDSETQTVVLNRVESRDEQGNPILQLRLQHSKSEPKVKWATDTVDNEFMGKKKSKCCCIYEKPKVFGESDSSASSDDADGDDDCTPHCRGHKKKCYRRKAHSLGHGDSCNVDSGSHSH